MKLGELEKLVLKYFWQFKQADAKGVHAYFKQQRGGSLNTIQSTLDRLFKKGLLSREKQGHAFIYRAALEQKAFIGQLIREVTDDFTAGDQDSLLAAFVSLSSQFDEEHLNKLEQLIHAHRQTVAQDK